MLSDKEIYLIAGRAFDFLHKYKTPPDPRFYEVWFQYLSRSNSRIVKAIDGLLLGEQDVDRFELERLYNMFVTNGFVDGAQKNIGLELEFSISAMDELIETTTSKNRTFQQTLTHTKCQLADVNSKADLLNATQKLIAQNEEILQSSESFGESLKRSRNEISALNRRLEELEAMTLQDPLTSLYNRRAFNARLDHELETASDDKPLCLAMVDIDHFKRVNDLLGHQAGDTVIVAVAKVLSEFANDSITVARYGGEEFAVLMADTDMYSAHNRLVRLKWQINDIQCLSEEEHKSIGSLTASFGQSIYKPGRSAMDLIKVADQKLYQAKRAGRNAVITEGLSKIDPAPN